LQTEEKIFSGNAQKMSLERRDKTSNLLFFFEFSRNNCYIFLKTHALLKKK